MKSWYEKREACYQLLEKHRTMLTDAQYENTKKVIGSNAIENIFVDEEDILNMIKIATGDMTADELIKRYKKSWSTT